jgi:hypothetical protein
VANSTHRSSGTKRLGPARNPRGLSPGLIRSCGLAAILGALLCILLTPIQVYTYSSSGWVHRIGAELAAYHRLYERLGRPRGLSEYAFFGRMFFVVYLLVLCGVLGGRASHPTSARRLERAGFVLLVAGLALGALGDFGDYWSADDTSGSTVAAILGFGFALETLCLAVVLLGTVLYGIGALRARTLPRWWAWLLIVAGPAAILTAIAVNYIPHGPMLAISLAWAAIGTQLLVQPYKRPRQVQPA